VHGGHLTGVRRLRKAAATELLHPLPICERHSLTPESGEVQANGLA
jgi:hypothetical protein